ncbi:MAG: TOBE domain-containing protein, partial [Jatrophihabitantaceae bacterium]
NHINLGVRPESFHAADTGGGTEKGDTTGLKIEVKLVEELGADAVVYGQLPGDTADSKHYVVRFDGRVPPRIGDTLSIAVRTGEEHAFHPETGERLG